MFSVCPTVGVNLFPVYTVNTIHYIVYPNPKLCVCVSLSLRCGKQQLVAVSPLPLTTVLMTGRQIPTLR